MITDLPSMPFSPSQTFLMLSISIYFTFSTSWALCFLGQDTGVKVAHPEQPVIR